MSVADDVGAQHFEVYVEHRGGRCTVQLLGELDLATVREAGEAFAEAEASDAESILVDIDGLGFIDSTGLGMLLEVSRRNQGADRLRFTRGTGKVAELLDLTGLDQALPFA